MNYIGVVSLLVDGVGGSNTIVIVSYIGVDASLEVLVSLALKQSPKQDDVTNDGRRRFLVTGHPSCRRNVMWNHYAVWKPISLCE